MATYSQTARPNELEARVGLYTFNNHVHDCGFLEDPYGKQTNSTISLLNRFTLPTIQVTGKRSIVLSVLYSRQV